MQKLLVIIFGILLVVLLGEAGYLYFLKQQTVPKTSSTIVLPSHFPVTSPSPQLSANNLKVLYQEKGDVLGRSIIYDYQNPKYPVVKGFSGAGIVNQPSYLFPYIVGAFVDWKSIPNSQDFYMSLINPLTNTRLGDIRIVYDSNSFPAFKDKTHLTVEYLNNPGHASDASGSIFVNKAGSNNPLSDFLHKGDAVVIIPFMNQGKLFLDENGDMVAHALAIRRNKQ